MSHRIAFGTLGCKVNLSESESYHRQALDLGWLPVDFDETADIYVINSCTVTHEAERQSRQLVRQAMRRNPEAKVVVTGCASATVQEDVHLVVPNLSKERLMETVARSVGIDVQLNPDSLLGPDAGRTRLFLKVTDGCQMSCSFCIIPEVRGGIRSSSPERVVAQIQRAVELGYHEVVLTGVHLGAYGLDWGERALTSLVRRILRHTSIRRLRLSSLDAFDFHGELEEIFRADHRLCPHLHLPVQSGSDRVLKAMRRPPTTQKTRRLIRRLREDRPDLAITTDVIVGYPGETETEFQETLALIEELGVSRVHVFPYSKREGTPAAELDGHLPPQALKERVKRMLALSDQLHTNWLTSWIGQEVEVLVEPAKRGVLSGITPHHLRVQLPHGEPLSLVRARVTGIEGSMALGQPI